MSLGIIAAMNEEGRALAGRAVPSGGLVQFHDGRILLISGIGPDRASLASRILIENGAAALMSWGFACGLQPGIDAGEIVIPTLVIAADGAIHVTDRPWRERLCSRISAHLSVCSGTLAESSVMMPDSSSKELLGRATGAVASDMESASICAAACNAGVPFLAIRAVTDTLGIRVPGSAGNCIDRQGRIRLLRLFSGLLRRPADLPDIIRLGRSFQAARKSLKSVAQHSANMFCLESR
jgi:adenosylhomocysteine nucleosidase